MFKKYKDLRGHNYSGIKARQRYFRIRIYRPVPRHKASMEFKFSGSSLIIFFNATKNQIQPVDVCLGEVRMAQHLENNEPFRQKG